MNIDEKTLRVIVVSCSAALMSMGSAVAQTTANTPTGGAGMAAHAPGNVYRHAGGDARDEARGAAQDVDQAVGVIRRMESDPNASQLLQAAKGVFVVPKYGRAAVGVGGRGGVGLLMVKHGNTWSSPAFYNFGGASAGAQIGVEGGSFVLVLNNDKAVNSFLHKNNWSLNADAGLTVVKWSKAGQVSAGKGDITLWSDVKGLFGGVAVSVTDIKFDRDQTSAYYGRTVAVNDVVNGTLTKPQTDSLKQALADAGASTGTHERSASAGNSVPDTGSTAPSASTANSVANGGSSAAGAHGAAMSRANGGSRAADVKSGNGTH